MKGFLTGLGMIVAVGVAAPLAAQSADDFAAKVINAPLPASLNVTGLPSPPAIVRVKDVEGGKVKRVKVSAAQTNPWAVSLGSPTTQPVKKGDRLVLAFYARTFGMAPGESAKIPTAQVQLNRAPYTTVFSGPIEVTDKLDFHQVQGKADRDYAAGEIAASLHLASQKQTIDFGPLFIINLDKQ